MYTITLTPEQLQIIDRVLSEVPYRVAAPLIADINRQIREQERTQQPVIEKPANA